jgi:hypothetical protein
LREQERIDRSMKSHRRKLSSAEIGRRNGRLGSIPTITVSAAIGILGLTGLLLRDYALAQGTGGGPAVGLGGGLSGIGAGIGAGVPIQINVPVLAGIPNGQGTKPIHISGRVLAGDEPVPRSGDIVRLIIDKSIVPMVLDKRQDDSDLSLNRRDELSRELYHALTTKQVRVVADEWMLARIEGQTDAPDRLRIEGTIRNIADPILVIDSVRRSH